MPRPDSTTQSEPDYSIFAILKVTHTTVSDPTQVEFIGHGFHFQRNVLGVQEHFSIAPEFLSKEFEEADSNVTFHAMFASDNYQRPMPIVSVDGIEQEGEGLSLVQVGIPALYVHELEQPQVELFKPFIFQSGNDPKVLKPNDQVSLIFLQSETESNGKVKFGQFQRQTSITRHIATDSGTFSIDLQSTQLRGSAVLNSKDEVVGMYLRKIADGNSSSGSCIHVRDIRTLLFFILKKLQTSKQES